MQASTIRDVAAVATVAIMPAVASDCVIHLHLLTALGHRTGIVSSPDGDSTA